MIPEIRSRGWHSGRVQRFRNDSENKLALPSKKTKRRVARRRRRVRNPATAHRQASIPTSRIYARGLNRLPTGRSRATSRSASAFTLGGTLPQPANLSPGLTGGSCIALRGLPQNRLLVSKLLHTCAYTIGDADRSRSTRTARQTASATWWAS